MLLCIVHQPGVKPPNAFIFSCYLSVLKARATCRLGYDMTVDETVVRRQEVAQRSERITALEREKASLIRELFNARSEPRRPHPDETTLI